MDILTGKMWDNDDWAARHIAKHRVTTREAWAAAFEDRSAVPFESLDQLRWPPFRRYWTIGMTADHRVLFVVWERHRAKLHLITAYEPDEKRMELYEKKLEQSKKSRRRFR